MGAQSYLWAMQLTLPVANNGTVVMPTPGFQNPGSYLTDEASVVHEGKVLNAGQFTLAWNGGFSQATITNRTGLGWGVRDTLYVAVAGIPPDYAGLEAQVAANTAAIGGHETRIAALEAAAP